VDFDLNSPLHYAAKEGRLLAVSYLMNIAFNPNLKDRYGSTALDLALRGGTLYHKYVLLDFLCIISCGLRYFLCRYCARLIQGWGGNAGSVDQTNQALLDELESISHEDVRAKMDQLLANGYDKKGSIWKSEEELLREFDTSVILAAKVCETKVKLDDAADRVMQHVSGIKNFMINFSNQFIPYLSALPSKSKKISHLLEGIHVILQNLDNCQVRSNEHVLDHLNSFFQIDSDEEAELFEEIDVMMDTQERAESFKGNTQRFLANSVECTFRRIFDLENAYRLVRIIVIALDLIVGSNVFGNRFARLFHMFKE
jgi:hypothetical protein